MKELDKALNAALLQSSFQLVAERQPQFITHFYDLLFERYPQVKALFGRNSRDTQKNADRCLSLCS